ncbi:hypothetical protein N8D56_21405 [Devosia sp. A8/3-2]|nr:hypothetical protein N8D56_21405 [Devosia sp. A8/3-2]
MTTYPAIEIRARKIHATRKENYARNYPWAGDLTFDGGERDFCMETARLELIEEDRAAAVESDHAAQLAAMTNEQLDANIAFCDFEAQGRYPREVLDAVRAERRLYVAEQFRRSVAAGAEPLNTVTGMLANFVSRSTALDSVREGSVHQMEAAE